MTADLNCHVFSSCQEHFDHQSDLYRSEVDSTTNSVQLQLQFITKQMHKVCASLHSICVVPFFPSNDLVFIPILFSTSKYCKFRTFCNMVVNCHVWVANHVNCFAANRRNLHVCIEQYYMQISKGMWLTVYTWLFECQCCDESRIHSMYLSLFWFGNLTVSDLSPSLFLMP